MKTRPSTRLTLPLEPEDRSDRAVVAVLRGLLEIYEANLEGAIDGAEPEALHDLRVSVRRSRSVQREFKCVFPPEELRAFRKGFRWLQQATGRARDLDVQVGELAEMSGGVPEELHPELQRLRDALETGRRAARREMAFALRSDRAVNLIADWRALLDGLSESPLTGRPDGDRPIGRLAGRRVRRVYRRMVKRGRRIEAGSPPEPYHELRTQGKELRYLLELFGTPLYPEEAVKPMIRSLKGLQDVLGRHQDRETQIETLKRVGSGDGGAADGGAAVNSGLIGLLVEQLGADKLAARRAFGSRFEVFAQSEHARMVKQVFR